jgi:hypothetical protein
MGKATLAEVRSRGVTDSEREELREVLSSRTFARAQRLVKLLEYIAEKYFLGQADQVCEYAIATEVLGRPSGFDPAQDAISRVEIHRLRKKLRDYYATEGAHRPIKIVIPPGTYTPVFLPDGNAAAAVPLNGEGTAELMEVVPVKLSGVENVRTSEPAQLAAPLSAPRGRLSWMAFALLPMIAVAVAALTVWPPKTYRAGAAPPAAIPTPTVSQTDDAVRIIAGYDRAKYMDQDGHTWLEDHFFEGGGGASAPLRPFVARTSDPALYHSGRLGLYAYNIPLKPGNYELKLHFVERDYGPGLATGGGENSRVMDVTANGQMLLQDFDIVSDAGGPQIADVRVFKDIQPGPDGYLRLGFHAKRERPLINAIEVEPAPPHKINPVRVVTQSNSLVDSEGRVWAADTYYLGGQPSNHHKPVAGTPDGDLFVNERYGHFSYAIPVAPGSYTVNLYFAETYWGPDNAGGGGPGQRVFNVFCNGLALLYDFDILKEAGANHALVKMFRGLQPNAQGKLNIEFVPVVNYATVYAIEVLDEGR